MKINQAFTGLLAGGMLAVTCSLAATPANAATLAQYTFDTGLASSDTDVNSTASDFSGGPGIGVARVSSFRGDAPPSVAITFQKLGVESKAQALNMGTYYQFNVDANDQFRLKLDSLSFETNVGPASNPDATGSYFTQFSSDGVNFNDIDTTFTQTQTPPPNGNVGNGPTGFVTRNVALGNSITSSFFTAPVYFRIYEYKNGSDNTIGGLRLDNVNVQGSVSPVPELSTGILFAIAMMGMGAFALRRKGGFAFSAPMNKSPFAL